jgi:anti-sigma regulatory factor (Ser/Thr protein kinase)
MNAMAPPRPTELHGCQVRLAAKPAAVGQARCHVQAAIGAWAVPVDEHVAVLLTSELVTNAIRHQPGRTITVVIVCSPGQLRVDVHDTSRFFPVLLDASVEDEAGRGLMLVDTLSAKWGCDRTPEGKAVYFTLAFRPDNGGGWRPRPASGARTGAVSRERPALTRPYGTRVRTPRRSPRCGGPQG